MSIPSSSIRIFDHFFGNAIYILYIIFTMILNKVKIIKKNYYANEFKIII